MIRNLSIIIAGLQKKTPHNFNTEKISHSKIPPKDLTGQSVFREMQQYAKKLWLSLLRNWKNLFRVFPKSVGKTWHSETKMMSEISVKNSC